MWSNKALHPTVNRPQPETISRNQPLIAFDLVTPAVELYVRQKKMKKSQSAKAAWICVLLLVAGFGAVQLKQLISLLYAHNRSQDWESVEGVILDERSVSDNTYQYSSNYGRSGSVRWLSSSNLKVAYSWEGNEEALFIPSGLMSEPGDLVDVAYSDGVYPEFVVRYRNIGYRLAWKAMWIVILLLGPIILYRAIYKKRA
ncbi:hypothetical protein NT6N_24240 [Oceaniferula spumae]|uniref:DUF3592 domain-containing protein n=1 Tax=Oceaniferula spumae TaxID=2979115 RepID=A0AAT9FNA3_9BACT